MTSWLARLQLPLLFVPLVLVGLGVYGSDFDVPAGRIFIGLFLCLPVLEVALGRRVERLANSPAASWFALAGIPVAALAYRPVHLAYWDEHSTSQALGFALLGLWSWGIWRIGAGRTRPEEAASTGSAAVALVVLGACWLSAALYPLLPVLALGAVFAVLAVAFAGDQAAPAPDEESASGKNGALVTWGALLAGIDLFLVVWDYRWVPSWAPHLALAFGAAALGWMLASRYGGVLLALGAANFLLAALVRAWVLEYPHSALAGLALGVLLARSARGSLGRLAVPWTVGIGIGMGLYGNLVIAGWRGVLLLPALLLSYNSYLATRAARSR